MRERAPHGRQVRAFLGDYGAAPGGGGAGGGGKAASGRPLFAPACLLAFAVVQCLLLCVAALGPVPPPRPAQLMSEYS
jgi:hypothetical protein